MEPGGSMGHRYRFSQFPISRFTVFGAQQYRLCGFMIAAVCQEGKRYTYIILTYQQQLNMQDMQHMFGPFLPHADCLLWTSRHIERLRGSLFGDSFSNCIVSIRLSFGYRFGYRDAFGIQQAQGRKGKKSNQTAPCNLNGCQDHEISHAFQALYTHTHINEQTLCQNVVQCLAAFGGIPFHGFGPLVRQTRAQIK